MDDGTESVASGAPLPRRHGERKLTWGSLATSSCTSRQAANKVPPPPRGTLSLFSAWEDQELQRHGEVFQCPDDAAFSEEPLAPYAGSPGWSNNEPEQKANPDGSLSFVEENWFRFLVGFVILLNMVLILSGMAKPELYWLEDDTDDLFLCLYVFELGLRLAHFKLKFFYWWPDAPWNWIDLLVVLAGMVYQWGSNLLHLSNEQTAVMSLRLFRGVRIFVRALRFLRVIRFVYLYFVVDPSWVDHPKFHAIVYVVIILNAVVMGLETDYQSPVWWWIENFVLLFFTSELACRLRLHMASFFTDPDDRCWNVLDVIIVTMGIFDQWWLDLFQHNGSQWARLMTLIRILRIVRLVRLVRLARSIRPLKQLIIGVIEAMQSMCWVLLLTLIIIYALAIAATRMMNEREFVDDPNILPEETKEMFGSLADSMFSLFALMNGHDFHKVTPLLDLMPWTKPIFVAFTICGSWALLSVMTGVVSDHIHCIREQANLHDREVREDRRETLVRSLAIIFASADKEGAGKLSREGFLEIFGSPHRVRQLHMAVNQPLGDMRLVFDWLDTESCGTVGFVELCEGLQCLEEVVTGRRLLNLDCGVKRQCTLLTCALNSVGDEVGMLRRDMVMQHRQLMEKIHSVLGPEASSRDARSESGFSAGPDAAGRDARSESGFSAASAFSGPTPPMDSGAASPQASLELPPTLGPRSMSSRSSLGADSAFSGSAAEGTTAATVKGGLLQKPLSISRSFSASPSSSSLQARNITRRQNSALSTRSGGSKTRTTPMYSKSVSFGGDVEGKEFNPDNVLS